VDEAPGVAALRGGLRHDEEPARREDALPEVLLLRWREEERQLRAAHFSYRGIERVLPQPLDEGAEGQDVGRFPGGEAARELVVVEFQRQAVREALVRRNHRDPRRMAFSEAREEFGFLKHCPRSEFS
jgi:hypothetical protein